MPQNLDIAIATTLVTSDRVAPTTCAHCPYFTSDQGVHGWCGAFDKPARPHHEKTKACDQEIEVLEHDSHITKTVPREEQSQIERSVHPTQSHKPPLTDKERHILAALLAWDSGFHVSAEEILEVEEVRATAWLSLSRGRTMPIAPSALSSIQQPLNSEHLGFSSLDCDQHSPDIEVDSDESSAPTYRVWQSWQLLGTFHQSSVDGRWLTYPTFGQDYNRHGTSDEAITAIVSAWNDAIEVRYEQGLEVA